MNLVDFNNETEISINTIHIQLINNTKTVQLAQYTQSKPIHTTDTTLQPTLIVVASINSGTSTLTQIFMYHLKGFFHSFKESQDSKYWNQCEPKQYIKAIKFIQNIIENKPNNISFSLIFNSHIKHNKNLYINNWNSSFNHLINNNDRNGNKCTHKDYMKVIGYNLSKHQYEKERKHIFFRNLSEMINHRNYHRWPNESNYNKLSEIYFYWDRASCYNGYPYIPSILSTNYAYTKLLYVIRDPLFQMYSNIRIFDEKTTAIKLVKVNEDTLMLTEEEANRRMNTLLKLLNSDFYSILFDLLKQNVSDKNENEILLWYVMLWAKNDNGKGSYKKQRVFDKCPYVNVLLYIKSGQIFNKIYGIKHFKLIQFEWETNNLLLASLYIYCWVTQNTINNNQEYNKCVEKYTQNDYKNIRDVIFSADKLKRNNRYGALKKYDWVFTNVTIFDKLITLFEICEKRLVELINKYPSIVLGKFRIHLWNKHRAKTRELIT